MTEPGLPDVDMQDLIGWATEIFPELQLKKNESLKKQVADEIYEYMLRNFMLRLDKYTILELLRDYSQDITKMVYLKHSDEIMPAI